MPLFCGLDPREISNLAIGSLGPMGAAARWNPAAPAGVSAGEAVGDV
jgi:hypothetical protein